jgi:GT2 family glycosyltransferase
MIRVSVVVPTFKRPELLSRCLDALSKQNLDPTAYEVIIADDAASDETKRLVENLFTAQIPVKVAQVQECTGVKESLESNSPPLPSSYEFRSPSPSFRYIPVTGTHGPAAARNAGWRAACGEIIAFTDDDCIPDPNWLKAGVSAFREEVVGVWGRTIVPLPDIPTDYELNAARLGLGEFVTANCFIKRDAIALVGGFDERFTLAWREDSDLFFTLLERGSNFVCAPDAIIIHPIRKAPWGVSLSQQRKGMFNALLYKKHPALYREKLQPVTPWHYYCIVAAIAVTLGGGLSGHPYFALAASGVWIGMTGHFCLQRLHQTSHEPGHIAEMIVTSILIPPLSIFWRIFGAGKFRVFFL